MSAASRIECLRSAATVFGMLIAWVLRKATLADPRRSAVINFGAWVMVGCVVGGLASLVMRTAGQHGVLLNVAVDIVGAALGGWLVSPVFDAANIGLGVFSLGSLIVSLLGAIVVLAIVHQLRRGPLR